MSRLSLFQLGQILDIKGVKMTFSYHIIFYIPHFISDGC